MASSSTTVPVSRVMKNATLTVHVTGGRRFVWRFKAAVWIIRFAALVAGFNIVLSREEEPE